MGVEHRPLDLIGLGQVDLPAGIGTGKARDLGEVEHCPEHGELRAIVLGASPAAIQALTSFFGTTDLGFNTPGNPWAADAGELRGPQLLDASTR
jgi:hypothetical protein